MDTAIFLEHCGVAANFTPLPQAQGGRRCPGRFVGAVIPPLALCRK